MTRRSTFNRRVRLIGLAISLCGVALGGRLVQLQGFDRVTLSASAAEQRLLRRPIPARPGDILDRRGRLLATSIRVPSLFLVPRNIDEPDAFAAQLAPVLDRNAEELAAEIDRHSDQWFLWLRRRMSDADADRIRELKLPKGTWGLEREYLRRHPQGSLAVHLLGLRDIDGAGRGGIEQAFDDLLSGRNGELVALRDAHGRVIDVRHELGREPVAGRSLVLTIDAMVQHFAEEALDELQSREQPQGSVAVVLDPKTADVLALASRPAFDPQRPEKISDGAWVNRAVAAMLEPGSTVKPLFVAWAMQRGQLKPEETFFCEQGAYRMGSRVLRDIGSHGDLDVAGILAHSSNIGMAKIAERLGNEELFHAAAAFGFGRPTGSGLPGEVAGLLRPLQRWSDYSIGSVPMGQEFAVTPLQLAAAHAAIASDGVLRQPRLLSRVIDPVSLTADPDAASEVDGQVSSPVIEPQICRWVREVGMTAVVEEGTGRSAAIPGYRIFGKTGTSQKYDPELGSYSHEKLICSFAGGAPADDPQVIVLVMIDEPRGPDPGGGRTAAPVVRQILKRTLPYLGVPRSTEK